MKRVIPKAVWLILLITISSSWLLAGTTGKIAGTITDKSGDEPLVGANVVVVGQILGASTDINGQYTILNIPPGTYTLQVTYIGYRDVTVEDVRVEIDQTAHVDVSMESVSFESEGIVVTAERDLIKTDVSTSVVSITDKEMDALPITSVVSAIGLEAGIQGGWGGALNGASAPSYLSGYERGKVSVSGPSIRGGGADNLLFMMDGVMLRDPRNNEPSTKLPLSSVEEISVERGGFNAEYGQVRSGIINVVTKEGDKQGYSGSIQVRVAPPQPKYSRVKGTLDIQDPNSFVLRPFFDDAVCWTGTTNGAWDEYTRKQYIEFVGWNEISRLLNTDDDPNNDLTPLGAQRAFMYEIRKKQINDQADYDIDGGFGGPVPFVSKSLGNLRFFTSYRGSRDMLLFPLSRPDYRDYDWTMRLNSDITPSMSLRISSFIGKQFTERHNWDGTGTYFYPHYPTEVAGVATPYSVYDLVNLFSDYNFAISDISHRSISAKLTHTLSPKTYYEISLETFRRAYNTRPAASRDTSKLYEVLPGYYEDSNPFGYLPGASDGIIINGGQHIAKARDFTVVNSTTLKADFSSQVNFNNLVKAGVEFDYFDLNFDYGTIASATEGKTYDNRVQMHVFPYRGAFYLQDKLETKGFTLNTGLRLDYSNSNTQWWDVDPFNNAFFSSKYINSQEFNKQSSKAQWQLSPRLGISHPISEKAKLFFNYGHFKQLPQYESLFRIQRNSEHAMSSYGNPNLILAKTISYELGFDYLVSDQYLFKVSAYYNDITEQQDFTHYYSTVGGYDYTYTSANNYEDVRGVELTFRKSTGQWLSGFVNYTYQVNTSGHFGSSKIYEDPVQQKQWIDETRNSYENRPIPQPYARANINITTPTDFGPVLWKQNILGNWLLNTVFNWQDGYWTTYNPNGLASIAYNVQAVDYWNVDMRLQKSFDVGKFQVQFFMDVHNVFNTLRLYNTGDADYMASLHLPKNDGYNNIPGNDKVGDYREPGTDFQPMEFLSSTSEQTGKDGVVYYEGESGKYFEYVNGAWDQLSKSRVDHINNTKSYIDMPNASTWWFLDPRRFNFGIKLSFNFN